MKKFISLVLFFSAFLLTSCNGLGNKDTIVARIGNENLYAEDLDFIVLQEQGGLGFQEKYRAALEDYMLSLAMLSDVETESSSYDSAWKEYES